MTIHSDFGNGFADREERRIVLGMSLAELEKEVRSLTAGEFDAFTRWLEEYAARRWDEQFERDVAAGKLDQLGRKADAAFEAGQCAER